AQCSLGVGDGGFDLGAIAHYVRVANELFDLGRPEGGDDGWVEVDERPAEAFALSQDGEPRQAGLESFQADLLQDTPVIADRQTPFVVVVVVVFGCGVSPSAAREAVVAHHDIGHGSRCLLLPDIPQMDGAKAPAGRSVALLGVVWQGISGSWYPDSSRTAADAGRHGCSWPRRAVAGHTPDIRLPCDGRGGGPFSGQHRTTTAGRNPAIRSRMPRNSSRGTATSDIWKTR